ncbi:hypothetical protein, partial [Rothia nasimurium]|uniref:hypothetical protein n=1 Tax=Rothia nasimurium TaxID=85336 RepID=UPI001ADDA4C1
IKNNIYLTFNTKIPPICIEPNLTSSTANTWEFFKKSTPPPPKKHQPGSQYPYQRTVKLIN